jgi:predicted amidohydrolase YtcJ
MLKIVRRANGAGLSVAIHAIGDRANREILNLFEKVTNNSRLFAPNRIEHVQIIRPSDVPRLVQLGITASVQPIHIVNDLPMIEQSVGPRGRFVYTCQDILDTGVTMAFGSDCPVADPNPFLGIHAAVTRQRPDGTPVGGWYPAQRLTVAETVWGFTLGTALASSQEAELGSITPGKLADLVVLDQDIFIIDPMEIANAKPVMTIFHGQEVFQA